MATAAVRLEEAKAAYHALLTGTLARVVVDQNGERVEYNNANRAALADYIAKLEDEVNGTTRTKGPMKVWMR